MRPSPLLLIAMVALLGVCCVVLLWVLTGPVSPVVKPSSPAQAPAPAEVPLQGPAPADPPRGNPEPPAPATRPPAAGDPVAPQPAPDPTPVRPTLEGAAAEPVVTILNPMPGDLLGHASITVRGLVEDPAVTHVTIAGQRAPVLDGVFTHELTLREGANIICVDAVGRRGQRGGGSVTVEADLEPPSLEVLEPAPGQEVRPPQLVVRGRVDDPKATVTVGDQPVLVSSEGTFSTRLMLQRDLTSVEVLVRDRLGRTAREVIPVSPPAPGEERGASAEPASPDAPKKRQYLPAPRRDISTEPVYVHLLRNCEGGQFEEASERVRRLLEEEGYRGTRFECSIWLALARGYDEHEQPGQALVAYQNCYRSCDSRKGAWHAAKARILQLGGTTE